MNQSSKKNFGRSINTVRKDVPMYGADQVGTIFKDKPANGWNVSSLIPSSALDYLLICQVSRGLCFILVSIGLCLHGIRRTLT